MRIILIYNTGITMSNKEQARQIDNAYRLDKALPNKDIFWRRALQLAHHPYPEKFAPYALNYLIVSTLTGDFPLNPLLIKFDPRDYHRFRFKSQTTFFLTQLASTLRLPSYTLFVNDIEHTYNILGQPSEQNLEKKLTTEKDKLRQELIHQGEVPNFSMLTKFWLRRESRENIFQYSNWMQHYC